MQDSNELKKITRVLITELERFKELKFIDFKDSMKLVVDELVKSQRLVRLANKMKNCWQSYFDD